MIFVINRLLEIRIFLVRGAIQNYVDFYYNFKTENQPHETWYTYNLMYMASICKVLAHSDFNCDIFGTSNNIGVAIAGQR